MLAFSNDYYGFIFRATQSVELFCTYIESAYTHDFKSCSCGRCCVDGGLEYIRRVADDFENIIEMAEYEENEHKEK